MADSLTVFSGEWAKLVQKLYDDLLSGSAKVWGELFAELSRQKAKRFLEKANQSVPEGRRTRPAPYMFLNILTEVRYLEEENLLTELYSNLLARAIYKERGNEAHPAFIRIIGQLSSDEAYILYKLRDEPEGKMFLKPTPDWLTYPEHFPMYISHLRSLDLGDRSRAQLVYIKTHTATEP